MYSYEDRLRAIELLIQYDMSYASVVQKLGYPTSTDSLRNWYKKYKDGADAHGYAASRKKFSDEQRKVAVEYYLTHGKCINRTCKKLGYPSRPTLLKWIEEDAPESVKHRCVTIGSVVDLSLEQKKQAIADLYSRSGTAQEVAEKYGINRSSLYRLADTMLKGADAEIMSKKEDEKDFPPDNIEALKSEIEILRAETEQLKKEKFRLQLEYDILEKAAEIIKKDKGISLNELRNREKAEVIDALRDKYRLKVLLTALKMSKSSYCYQKAAKNKDKYKDLRENIKSIFHESNETYGYRRVRAVLVHKGYSVSEKVIRRLMKTDSLTVRIPKEKRYSSYAGEITPAVENIVQRDFHSDAPNKKWLTDITEFQIPAGKVYLSPIIDCFDGMVAAWTIGLSPNAELVNTMLDAAILSLKDDEKPIVHSDRGAHYRWPGWIERMEAAGLTRSMSKKGCSPDNSACEGFFGRLKNEMFYSRNWTGVSLCQFTNKLDEYIRWYNEKRVKISLGGMSPAQYRRKLRLTA